MATYLGEGNAVFKPDKPSLKFDMSNSARVLELVNWYTFRKCKNS